MRLLGAAALLLLWGAPAWGGTVHVGLRQTLDLDVPGATAAFAVDVEIADVAARSGRITMTGRSVGETQVTVVSKSGVESWDLVVDPPPVRISIPRDGAHAPAWGSWSAQYDSETTRLANTVDLVERQEGRAWRLHLVNVTRTTSREDGSARTSFPALSLELETSLRRIVLFDEVVRHSPLTLDGTALRGVHVHQGALELHAGSTAATLYEDVLLPSDGEKVFGASYRFGDDRSSLTPSVYAFPTASTTGGARGVTASLLYRYGRERDKLRLQAEAGWGGKPGLALDLEYASGENRFSLDLRHMPAGFASVGIGRPHGTFLDAAYSGRLGPRLTFATSGSYGRHELPGIEQRSGYGSAELRAVVAQGWSATAGARGDTFDSGGSSRISSVTLPLGLAWDGRIFGVSALYRYQRNSATSRGGNGGRLGVRASGRHLSASAYVDAQKDVPTLELIFREEPELARLFAELGVIVHTAEDVARVLRENPALAQLGYVEGVTVRLDPSRVQAGADLSWFPGGDAAQRFRLHVVLDRVQAVQGLRETRIASLSYSRRVAELFDVTAGYTRWTSNLAGTSGGGSTFLLGVRKGFDGPLRLPFGTHDGTIGGVVRRDDAGTGSPGKEMPAVAGVEVRLDGRESAMTDAKGRFSFPRVPRGVHRVEAVLPSDAGAYFTTPSSVLAEPGRELAFGVSYAAARLLGSVRDDAGNPVPAVSVTLEGPGGTTTSATDSEGRFHLTTGAGSAVARLDAASLPEGYDASAVSTCEATLVAGTPSRCDLLVRAHRSISGRLSGNGAPGALVRVVELNRDVKSDGEGRWALRGLPPGTFTLEAGAGARRVTRKVTVPAGPSSQHGLDIDLGGEAVGAAPPERVRVVTPRLVAAAAPVVPVVPVAPTLNRGALGVQVASYRSRETAEREARSIGVKLGRTARVVQADLREKGTWYRVIVETGS